MSTGSAGAGSTSGEPVAYDNAATATLASNTPSRSMSHVPKVQNAAWQRELDFHSRAQHLPSCAQSNICLNVSLRWYQTNAINETLGRVDVPAGQPRQSLVIVLPCGSGKTTVGIGMYVAECRQEDVANRVGNKKLLVVSHGPGGAQQWYDSFLRDTNLHADQVCLLGSTHHGIYNERTTRVVIATLQSLTMTTPNEDVKRIQKAVWHRAILDECHTVPAKKYQAIFDPPWNIERWTGLTASPLRADGNFKWLVERIGGETTPVMWRYLEKQGFLVPMQITLVRCPLSDEWRAAYERTTCPETRRNIELFNPRKLRVLEYLLHHWGLEDEARPEGQIARTTIIFIDSLALLHWVAKILNIKYIEGSTSAALQESYFQQLRSGEMKTIIMSRCGDQGIDLPRVSRVVILDALEGSERQHTQRCGRALRPFPGKPAAQIFDIHTSDSQNAIKALHRVKFLETQNYTINSMAIRQEMVLDKNTGAYMIKSGDYQVMDLDKNPWLPKFVHPLLSDHMLKHVITFNARQEANAGAYQQAQDNLSVARQSLQQHMARGAAAKNSAGICKPNRGIQADFNRRRKRNQQMVKNGVVSARASVQEHETLLMELKCRARQENANARVCTCVDSFLP